MRPPSRFSRNSVILLPPDVRWGSRLSAGCAASPPNSSRRRPTANSGFMPKMCIVWVFAEITVPSRSATRMLAPTFSTMFARCSRVSAISFVFSSTRCSSSRLQLRCRSCHHSSRSVIWLKDRASTPSSSSASTLMRTSKSPSATRAVARASSGNGPSIRPMRNIAPAVPSTSIARVIAAMRHRSSADWLARERRAKPTRSWPVSRPEPSAPPTSGTTTSSTGPTGEERVRTRVSPEACAGHDASERRNASGHGSSMRRISPEAPRTATYNIVGSWLRCASRMRRTRATSPRAASGATTSASAAVMLSASRRAAARSCCSQVPRKSAERPAPVRHRNATMPALALKRRLRVRARSRSSRGEGRSFTRPPGSKRAHARRFATPKRRATPRQDAPMT